MSHYERTPLGPELQVMISRAELLSTASRLVLNHVDHNEDVLVNMMLLPTGQSTEHAPAKFAATDMDIHLWDDEEYFVRLRGWPTLDDGFQKAIEPLRDDENLPEAEIVLPRQDDSENFVGTMNVYLKTEKH